MRNLLRAVAFCTLLSCGIAFADPSANLVTNPSFEAGAAGWQFTGSSGVDTHDPGAARTGIFMGYVNMVSPGQGTISQDIPTMPGQDYLVQFWVSQNGSANASATASFGSVVFANFYVDNTTVPVAPLYQEHSAVITAQTSLTPLVFTATTVYQTIFFEDALVAAVPEPGSVELWLVGMLVVGLACCRSGPRPRWISIKGWHLPRHCWPANFATSVDCKVGLHLAIAALTLLSAQGSRADPVTYYETVYNATGDPGVEIGLGTQVFRSTDVTLHFTFVGDTDGVSQYLTNGTTGFINTAGTASVRIVDSINNISATAVFNAGEVYVGTDITNGGVGFGSRLFPIYPYALFANPSLIDLSQPDYDLRHGMGLLSTGLSCIWPNSQDPCLNQPGQASNYTLQTDQGAFWVTFEGPTQAYFEADVTPMPEPSGTDLMLMGLAVLGAYSLLRSSRISHTISRE